jgi:hypothetical protein
VHQKTLIPPQRRSLRSVAATQVHDQSALHTDGCERFRGRLLRLAKKRFSQYRDSGQKEDRRKWAFHWKPSFT